MDELAVNEVDVARVDGQIDAAKAVEPLRLGGITGFLDAERLAGRDIGSDIPVDQIATGGPVLEVNVRGRERIAATS